MDPYLVLGVSEQDSSEIIKEKYRRLILKHHPDKGGNPGTFVKINEAYNNIMNRSENKKEGKYDQPSTVDSMSIFKAFLKKQIMKEYKDLFMTLEEMYTGKKIKINLAKYIDCTSCTKTYCHHCTGTGKLAVNFVMFGLQKKINQDCSSCDGFGFTRDCSECENGYVTRTVKFILKIKKGCIEGDKYSVEDNSVIFIIKQYKHPRFLRYENDLILHKSISLYEAVSCLKIKCKHLNNKVYTFSTCKTIQNDIIYQLEHLGMPDKCNTTLFGNLYIKFDILLPLQFKLSCEEDKILKKLFSIVNCDSETSEEDITCVLQQSNEQNLDNSLVRLLRACHH